MVQPDRNGELPWGPVSRYGVARPAAVSGFAGTMMSQATFPASCKGLTTGTGAGLRGGTDARGGTDLRGGTVTGAVGQIAGRVEARVS
jgi:hypothetical protein